MVELTDFQTRGDDVPCTQDHDHNEICRFFGDAPINVPTRSKIPDQNS
jgi:hypothetical protein